MKCTDKQNENLMTLYKDNQLNAEEVDKFESHLAECDACSEGLNRAQPVWSIMRPSSTPSLEDYIEQRNLIWKAFASKPSMVLIGATFSLFLTLGINTYRTSPAIYGYIGSEPIRELQARGDVETGDLVTYFGGGPKEGHTLSEAQPKVIGLVYFSVQQKGLMSLSAAEPKIMGLVQMDREKLGEGIEYLNQAAKLARALGNQAYLAESYYYLGKAHLMKEDLDQAESYFEKVLSLDPTDFQFSKTKQKSAEILTILHSIKGERR